MRPYVDRRRVPARHEDTLGKALTSSQSRQDEPRVDKAALEARLEVQMRTGRVSRRPDRPDRASLEDAFSASNPNRTQVAIHGLPTGTVIDHDHVTVADGRPPGKDHNPAVCRPHQIACATGDVDRQMARPVVIPGHNVIRAGPDEPSGADRPRRTGFAP